MKKLIVESQMSIAGRQDNVFTVQRTDIKEDENGLFVLLSDTPQSVQWTHLLSHYNTKLINCSVGWGCRIHLLHLCRGVRPPTTNECPGYDTKQSDGEVPAVLELWGTRSTPSLPSLPSPLWPGVVAPDRALSMG